MMEQGVKAIWLFARALTMTLYSSEHVILDVSLRCSILSLCLIIYFALIYVLCFLFSCKPFKITYFCNINAFGICSENPGANK